LKDTADFVHWFRSAAPYIHGFRGKTFVIAFGGTGGDGGFVQLAHDVNLLNSLGWLVLIHGCGRRQRGDRKAPRSAR
jgi:amino-acid N-acetyltransferase